MCDEPKVEVLVVEGRALDCTQRVDVSVAEGETVVVVGARGYWYSDAWGDPDVEIIVDKSICAWLPGCDDAVDLPLDPRIVSIVENDKGVMRALVRARKEECHEY